MLAAAICSSCSSEYLPAGPKATWTSAAMSSSTLLESRWSLLQLGKTMLKILVCCEVTPATVSSPWVGSSIAVTWANAPMVGATLFTSTGIWTSSPFMSRTVRVSPWVLERDAELETFSAAAAWPPALPVPSAAKATPATEPKDRTAAMEAATTV